MKQKRNKWLDFIYVTKTSALEQGFNADGRQFGIPVWIRMDENDTESLEADTKMPMLEPLVSLCLMAFHFLNSLRPPGEQLMFPFQVRPILHHLYLHKTSYKVAVWDELRKLPASPPPRIADQLVQMVAMTRGPDVRNWPDPADLVKHQYAPKEGT